MQRAVSFRSSLFSLLLCSACAQTAQQTQVQSAPGSQKDAAATQEGSALESKLRDPETRVEALLAFLDDFQAFGGFEPATSKNKDILEQRDKLLPVLSQVYVESYDTLPTESRKSLIRLLAHPADARATESYQAALSKFSRQPSQDSADEDVRYAIEAYRDLGTPALAPGVIAAFEKLKAHTSLGAACYKTFVDAMVQHPSPPWEKELIARLQVPLVHPKSGKTPEEHRTLIAPYRDQLFWQVTAAMVLGKLKSEKAIVPLLQVLAEPQKGDVGTTALLALTRIGEPAAQRAAQMLKNDDPIVSAAKDEVARLSGKRPTYNPAYGAVTALLGMSGGPSALAGVLDALQAKPTDVEKILLARELPKMVSGGERAQEAYKKAFVSIAPDTVVSGIVGLVLLAETTSSFYDPSLAPWLIKTAKELKVSGELKGQVQKSLITAALKVGLPADWEAIKKAALDYDLGPLEASLEPLLQKCESDPSCYVDAVSAPEHQGPSAQFVAIKSAYMVAMLGSEKERDVLVANLARIENPAVHYVALLAIDQLSPAPDAALLNKLEQYASSLHSLSPEAKMAVEPPLLQVIARLEGRAVK